MGLSAVVITYNEEAKIQQCLHSLAFADEIIALDSFSTDRTVEIAKQFTQNVSCRKFEGYSDQWNAAIALASQEWVLIMAADEIVTEELAADIQAAILDGKYDAYWIPRSTEFLGRRMRFCGWYPDFQLRLAKKAVAKIPHRLVHETMEVSGVCGYLKHDLLHYSYVSMDDCCRKMIEYSRAGAQQRFNDGRRFKVGDLLVNPWLTFFKMYVIKQGFRDGIHGLILSVVSACSVAIRYSMLWDMGQRVARDRERKK